MELSRFLQQDIEEFLERKTKAKRESLSKSREEEMELFSIERDYAKETEEALEDDNLAKAKRIFDDLRTLYNKLDQDSEERERIFSILEEVYAKIKDYLSRQNIEQSLADEIKDIEEHGLGKAEQTPKAADIKDDDLKGPSVPKQDNTIEDEIKKERLQFEKAALDDQIARERMHKEMGELVKKIIKRIENKDLRGAVREYHSLKETFAKYPADDKFRKVEWYNRVVEIFNQIKALKDSMMQEHEKKRKILVDKRAEKEKELIAEQRRKISRIKHIIKNIISSIDSKELEKAESSLIDVRREIALLDRSQEVEKHHFSSIISKLNNRIQFIKNSKRKEQDKKDVADTEQKKKSLDEKSQAEMFYRKGLDLQHKGHEKEAEGYFVKVLKIMPEHLAAKIRIEQINRKRGTA